MQMPLSGQMRYQRCVFGYASYTEWKFAKQNEQRAEKPKKPRVNPDNPSYGYAEDFTRKGLTNAAETAKIKVREMQPLSPSTVVPTLREESSEWVAALTSEEARAIKKYTKNSGDIEDGRFFLRLNAMLRGDAPHDDTLQYYADQISGAIAKFRLAHDIICYRTMASNPFIDLPVGAVVSPEQFLSTSVSTKGALKHPFVIEIYTPAGSNGAYIELVSEFPKQREFVFNNKCKYLIIENGSEKAIWMVII